MDDKPLSEHTVVELRAIARDYGITGASYMVKADLVDAIERDMVAVRRGKGSDRLGLGIGL